MPRSLPALAALLAACARPPTPAETVRIDGSPGVAPLVAPLARAYEARHPGATVRMGAGLGASARLQALADGAIDVAMASHGVNGDDVRRRGMAVHEIAKVAVVFAVHAGVPVGALTERQVCDVYAGRVTSWRALGGPDLPIAPLARPAGEVDADVATAGVGCLTEALAAGVARRVERPEEMAAALAATPGAIGMTSAPFVEQSGGRLRALSLGSVAPSAERVRAGAYPLVRQSFLLTRAAPAAAVARFLAFVRSPEGAQLIRANGAVPVPAP